MLRRPYNWVMRFSASRYALLALAVVSFAESSVFPIPPDVLMIPMILAVPQRAFLIAGVCLAFSILGGLLGYMIGAFVFEPIGRPLLQLFVSESRITEFTDGYNKNGARVVLFAAATPIPYKAITILSGTTGLSLTVFVLSSVVGRGARFFLIAALLWKFGDPVREFIERWFGNLTLRLIPLSLQQQDIDFA